MSAFGNLGIRDDRPELVLAQYRAFSRQLPLMYLILIVNCAALGWAFRFSAPPALSVYFPMIFGAFCSARFFHWWHVREHCPSAAKAVRHLRMLVVLTFALGAAFALWGVVLAFYGDAMARAHVVFLTTITATACAICLSQLRVAALGVLGITNGLLLALLLVAPQDVPEDMAVNGLIFGFVLMILIHRNYADFAALIRSKQVLAERTAEAVQLFEENRELATKDALTGIPNRRWFFAQLAAAVEAARAGGLPSPVVAVIDLDGFKPVNDLHGHSAGDSILVEVAQRLMCHASNAVRIARLGGDEFAVIFTDVRSRDEARRLGEILCQDLGQPYDMGDFVARVHASLGMSEVNLANCSGGVLYEQADYALNFAKRSARGEVTFFNEDHAQEIRDTSLVDQALRAADLRRELCLNYQPIIDGRSGRITGFEALARWRSPTLGPIPPTIFIGAAERSGRISAITMELLTQMLRDMGEWPDPIRLSFNLSVHDICSPDTMARIAALIASSGHAPSRIDFEITETTILHDFDHARRSLGALKSMGCGIALDDFGTGYSSLSYVHQLPLDKIKIDRAFVRDLARDPIQLALIRSVMGLCDNLGLECVIEGIENGEQRDLIGRMGAPHMQGYLFGKPKSLRGALAMLVAEGGFVVSAMAPKRPSEPRSATAS